MKRILGSEADGRAALQVRLCNLYSIGLTSAHVKVSDAGPHSTRHRQSRAGIRKPSQMQLIAMHLLEARRVGRAAEKRSEVLDPLHVVMWVFGAKLRIVMSSIMRWGNGPWPRRSWGCSCVERRLRTLDLKTGRPVALS